MNAGEKTGSPLEYVEKVRGKGSGDPLFDEALAQTLLKLSTQFGVLPTFRFYTEPPSRGANAGAQPKNVEPGKKGLVQYGRRLLAQQKKKLPEVYPAHVVAVCAHEFGHIVQYGRGTIPKLNKGQKTKRRSELHADFLAGWFAGFRKKEDRDFPAAEIAMAQYNVGDEHVNEVEHHGRPEERGAAVVQGYRAAMEGKTFDEAFDVGFDWAKTI